MVMMMEELLIWVDESDREIGYGEKWETHRKGKLHRAFSIFVFDWQSKKMLLQRRADEKYHSGGLWSNACCSHPRKGEEWDHALRMRLKEELGLTISTGVLDAAAFSCALGKKNVMYACGTFIYREDYRQLSEYELDHVFLYCPAGGELNETTEIPFHPAEVKDIRWIALKELWAWLETNPEDFSAWFPPAFELAYKKICRLAHEQNMIINA